MNKTDTLKITGMSCQMCVKHVTRALQSLEGVSDVIVDLEAGTARVTYKPESVGLDEFKSAVDEAGYAVTE